MTDALTEASDSRYEERAIKEMPGFSLEEALKVRNFLEDVMPRNRDKAKDVVLAQIEFYLGNEDLKKILNGLYRGPACGVRALDNRISSYLEHAESCEKCQNYLLTGGLGQNLDVSDVSHVLKLIEDSAPKFSYR
jgi:hypothetical protein